MTLTYSLQQLPEIAQQILQHTTDKVLTFKAEMGVGKTTLIKELCRQLQVEDTISSPTYSLVNEYRAQNQKIFHFDFYRIDSEEEAYDIGFEDYLNQDAWIFIEWPEKITNLLPKKMTQIQIELMENGERELILVN